MKSTPQDGLAQHLRWQRNSPSSSFPVVGASKVACGGRTGQDATPLKALPSSLHCRAKSDVGLSWRPVGAMLLSFAVPAPRSKTCCGSGTWKRSSLGTARHPRHMLGRALRQGAPARLMSAGSSVATAAAASSSCRNVTWQEGGVCREAKEALLQQRGCVVWFTGLSGSGKSTVAAALEHALHGRGVTTALLDGDNVRHGLNCNLGFSEEDRAENIRRVGEVTKLFVDAGIIALASFISPYRRDRDNVRARLGPKDFIEVFMKVPLEVCEQRDAKGLYAMARAGKIKCFTGIDDPYEPPLHPEITLEVEDAQEKRQTPEAMACTILSYLQSHGYIRSQLANNAVNGPPRAIADWSEKKAPVLDYSI